MDARNQQPPAVAGSQQIDRRTNARLATGQRDDAHRPYRAGRGGLADTVGKHQEPCRQQQHRQAYNAGGPFAASRSSSQPACDSDKLPPAYPASLRTRWKAMELHFRALRVCTSRPSAPQVSAPMVNKFLAVPMSSYATLMIDGIVAMPTRAMRRQCWRCSIGGFRRGRAECGTRHSATSACTARR